MNVNHIPGLIPGHDRSISSSISSYGLITNFLAFQCSSQTSQHSSLHLQSSFPDRRGDLGGYRGRTCRLEERKKYILPHVCLFEARLFQGTSFDPILPKPTIPRWTNNLALFRSFQMNCAESHLKQKSEMTQRITCFISRVSIIHQIVQADSTADTVGASVAFYSQRMTESITPSEKTSTEKDVLCTMMKDEGIFAGLKTSNMTSCWIFSRHGD